MPKIRVLRPRGDCGSATMDYVGTLALVVLLLTAVLAAYTANSGLIGDRTASLICQLLTAGQGDCGGDSQAQERQPTAPCVIGSQGNQLDAGVSVLFVEIGGERGFTVETLSDKTFKVTAVEGGGAGVTAGVGASTSFTVADNQVGMGASASVSGGVTFQSGQEWVVGSRAEVDRLTSADNWDKFDDYFKSVVPGVGHIASWGRERLGVGESYPEPSSVYVAGGATVSGSAYAGFGNAVASAEGNASRMLGYRHDNGNGNNTYYFETTVDGSGSAELAGIVDQSGAGLGFDVKVMTAVTVDGDGQVVEASRSALAAGESSGLTNALFGGDPSIAISDKVTGGTQWDATLRVRDQDDRDAVMGLLLSSGINPLGIGVDDDPGGVDPLGSAFMDAVRDRGDLTRYDVEMDDTTWFQGSGEVGVVAKVGLSGGYGTSSMDASNHQYWDGRRFADRTNC